LGKEEGRKFKTFPRMGGEVMNRHVEGLKEQAEDLEKLVNAHSSDDLGGFIDVPLKRTAAGRARKRR